MNSQDLSDQFHEAIIKEDLQTVRRILINYPELIKSSANKYSPLWTAANTGNEKIVELLVKCGADVSEKKIDTNEPCEWLTLLHWLAKKSTSLNQKCCIEVAKVLIMHGADVNAYTSDSEIGTPFEVAISEDNVVMAELFIKNGAKLEGPEWKGKSPAQHIFKNRPKETHKKMLLLLIQYGLDIGFHNENGENLLIMSFYNYQYYFTTTNDYYIVEIAEILINCGVPLDEGDKFGYTPLHRSIYKNNILLPSMLIKKGADVNKKTFTDHFFPLHTAVLIGSEGLVELLLLNGAAVDAVTSDGSSALDLSFTTFHDKNITSLLIRYGAELSKEDDANLDDLLDNESSDYVYYVFTIVKELSMLTYKNIPVSKNNMKIIEADWHALGHFKNCIAELTKMASTKFYSPYSYYTVLNMSKSMKKLAYLTKNKEFVSNFKANLKNFSYFKDDLQTILQEAVTIKKRLETIVSRLNSVFKDVFPAVVIKKLSEILCVDD